MPPADHPSPRERAGLTVGGVRPVRRVHTVVRVGSAARIARVVCVLVLGLATTLGLTAVPAGAAVSSTVGAPGAKPTPTTDPPAPAPPVPGPTAAPVPTSNPFTGPVGGAALGDRGVVVDQQATPAPPKVDVASYVVADLDSGEVLAAKNAHLRLPPASTLKALTAVTLLPRLDKRARYTATPADTRVEGSRVGIETGRAYTIDQLFYGLFLPSGNDAATALGNAAGGSRTAVEMMNTEARRLGAFDTHVVNTSGLDAPGQVSSAYDLALVAREGMSRSDFRRYVATLRYNFPGRDRKTFQIQNLNKLLGHYPGAIGVKNGYTTMAHSTLVGAAEQDGRRLVVVLMRSKAPYWTRAAALLDWGFTAGAKAKPVGTLVTGDDVARAAAARAPGAAAPKPGSTKPAGPAASPSKTPTLAPGAAGPNAPGLAISTPESAWPRLPVWLWLMLLVFLALSGMRVYSYVRSRR
ncbi:D-alanyl-D-alanine carboxypeptidase family protein [Actinopolymorpha singaporensis]|uniref:D-alanyl-D-alanine carboxypeptidase (Penicillin-binding protein 5/6) n=1 Tax=Actinopolymorpha singaporensis TaxID=117157 RepID=A0A1H1SLG5_9ACTN|nr:D-alanyl-D-alanine carboxypeptidase family protein [Actinopolymorpha singaporensis]SDS48688.1 D-alanyl-D-alanine carboxypeptidase (penicillin-binding protein 5/6) [Actinopolymorpha singaporensis]